MFAGTLEKCPGVSVEPEHRVHRPVLVRVYLAVLLLLLLLPLLAEFVIERTGERKEGPSERLLERRLLRLPLSLSCSSLSLPSLENALPGCPAEGGRFGLPVPMESK